MRIESERGDFPDPLTPVITTNRFRGIRRLDIAEIVLAGSFDGNILN